MNFKLIGVNNFYLRSKVFLLTVLIGFLSQVSVAQNNVQDTIVINGREFPSVRAFNYHFSLLSVRLYGGSDGSVTVEELFGESFKDRAMDAYQPFIDAEVGLEFLHRYSLTPLIYAVVDRDADAVNFILAQEGADSNLPDSNGFTPLIWAAITGDEGIARALVDAGADVESQGSTAIWYAARKGNQEIVNYFIEVLEN